MFPHLKLAHFRVTLGMSGGLLLFSITSWILAIKTYSTNWSIVAYWTLGKSLTPNLEISLILDWMSLIFLGTVSIITASVIAFSLWYMETEKFKLRFILMILVFVSSMGLLVCSSSSLIMIIGWDGLGLSSYLLVVYFNNKKSASAGMMTVMTNRIGDVALIMVISLMALHHSWILTYVPLYLVTIKSLIILASFTKSAQIPFSAWLPAAMAAPTPVSALVHSSTLVTAGVFLLIRVSHNCPGGESVIFWFGTLTLLMASLSALAEVDAKKIVALSTLSQLGLMMMMLGMKFSNIAFFHLITHAFFKSLLFIAMGDYMHMNNSSQDLRHTNPLPFDELNLSSVMFVANSSLMGFPFMAGFYTKDMFLEMSFMGGASYSGLAAIYPAILLTAVYTVRFIKLVCFTVSLTSTLSCKSGNTNLFLYTISLSTLAILAGSNLLWVSAAPELIFLSIHEKSFTLIALVMTILVAFSISYFSLPSKMNKSYYYLFHTSGLKENSPIMADLTSKILRSGEKNFLMVNEAILQSFSPFQKFMNMSILQSSALTMGGGFIALTLAF